MKDKSYQVITGKSNLHIDLCFYFINEIYYVMDINLNNKIYDKKGLGTEYVICN